MVVHKNNIEKFITAWKILGSLNLVDTIFNHISFINGSGTMLMNPDGILAEQINKTNVSVFPLKEYIHQDAVKLHVNADGLKLHSALHLVRKRTGVIIHTHSPNAIAVGNYSKGLLPLSQTAIEFVNDIETIEYNGMFRKNSLTQKLKRFALKGGVAILRQHGILVVADTIEEAVYLAYYIEEACKIQILSLLQGKIVRLPKKSIIKSTELLMKDERGRVSKDFFNALKRKFNHN